MTVEVLANTECSNLYGPIITENMMCTSGQNSRGSCFGDSGGPAIVKNDEGFYVQVLFESNHVRQSTILYIIPIISRIPTYYCKSILGRYCFFRWRHL